MINLSDLKVGDKIEYEGTKYEIAGFDVPFSSNANMKTQTLTIHFKDIGYGGTNYVAKEDVKTEGASETDKKTGNISMGEFRNADLKNSHEAPPGGNPITDATNQPTGEGNKVLEATDVKGKGERSAAEPK